MNDPTATSPTEIQMIDVNLIRRNTYNPNRMTAQQRMECRREIDHLGQLPQPLILRRAEVDAARTRFEIIDGEHRYDDAVDRGMPTVPCIILDDVDDFEARRQTFKRNRGGRDNKVVLGRMFAEMQALKGMSRRKLAKEICVPESTIRAAEEYARAADLRSACAPDTADADIAKLKLPQVQMYLALKGSLRDKWLDAGADLRAFDVQRGMMWEELAGLLGKFELGDFVADGDEFYDSVSRLAKLAVWLDGRRAIAGIVDYSHAAAKHGLDVRVMDALPYRRQGDQLEIAIELAVWDNAVASVSGSNAASPYEELLGAQAAVRTALAAAGIDLANVLGPVAAEDYAVVAQAPQYIRDSCSFLALSQQRWLAEVDADGDAELEPLINQAKQETLGQLHDAGKVTMEALQIAYRQHRRRLLDQQVDESGDDDSDPATALADLIVELVELSDAVIADRPAVDVLRERIDGIDTPEFNLLAAAVAGQLDAAAGREWLHSVCEETAPAHEEDMVTAVTLAPTYAGHDDAT